MARPTEDQIRLRVALVYNAVFTELRGTPRHGKKMREKLNEAARKHAGEAAQRVRDGLKAGTWPLTASELRRDGEPEPKKRPKT